MKKLFLAAILSTAVLPAFAQTATPPAGGDHEGCRKKIEQLCPGVQPGGGRIKECLKQHNTTIEAVCPERAAEAQKHHPGNGRPNGQQGGTPPAAQAPVATPPAPAEQ